MESDGRTTGPLPLATGTPERQREALEALREAFRRAADGAEREEDGAATAGVLIEGNRDARWQYVQWIMQVASDPGIRIYKVRFRVRGDR